MKLLLFFLFILASLLFIGSPNDYNSRLIREIWESGHFFLFAGLVFFLLKYTQLSVYTSFSLVLATVLFSVSLGLITELVQFVIGRSFELKDILNDLIGGLAGFSVVQYLRSQKKGIRLISITTTIILALLGLRSLTITILDEWLMTRDFPILSSFETPFELSRWDTQLVDLSISKKINQSGKQSMQVKFFAGKYPEITLNYFEGNWQGYEHLQFSIFNESDEPFKMNVKIYDAAHPTSGYRYSDRFNSEITVYPGWNKIQYSLNVIRDQPKHRAMDLTTVNSFSLFMVDLDEPITVYIDDVILTMEN